MRIHVVFFIAGQQSCVLNQVCTFALPGIQGTTLTYLDIENQATGTYQQLSNIKSEHVMNWGTKCTVAEQLESKSTPDTNRWEKMLS